MNYKTVVLILLTFGYLFLVNDLNDYKSDEVFLEGKRMYDSYAQDSMLTEEEARELDNYRELEEQALDRITQKKIEVDLLYIPFWGMVYMVFVMVLYRAEFRNEEFKKCLGVTLVTFFVLLYTVLWPFVTVMFLIWFFLYIWIVMS